MTVRMAWEPDGYELAVGSTWVTSTTSTLRDTTYTPNVILTAHSGTREYSMAFPSASEFWCRATVRIDAINGTLGNGLLVFRAGTTNQLRIRPDQVGSAGGRMRLYRWNGSSWDIVGTAKDYFYFLPTGAMTNLVIHVSMHATTGTFRVFMNDALVMDVTGNITGPGTACDNVVLGGLRTDNAQAYWSQLAMADFCLVGSNVANYSPTAAGTYTEWTGAYTDLDEADHSLTDDVDTNTAAQRFTYNFSDTSVGQQAGSRVIRAFGINARVELDSGSTPTAIRHMLRTASTDYESGDLALTADDVDRSVVNVWETNPNTTVLWTFSDIDGLEAGHKSV